MSFCENCGSKVKESAKFCNNCGANLNPSKIELIQKSENPLDSTDGTSLNVIDESNISVTSINSENDAEKEKTTKIRKKPFYKSFWFWFWMILAALFYLGSLEEENKSMIGPCIFIIGIYFFYNGFIKKDSWWGGFIEKSFSGKTGKVIFILLAILFVFIRVLISIKKNQ